MANNQSDMHTPIQGFEKVSNLETRVKALESVVREANGKMSSISDGVQSIILETTVDRTHRQYMKETLTNISENMVTKKDLNTVSKENAEGLEQNKKEIQALKAELVVKDQLLETIKERQDEHDKILSYYRGKGAVIGAIGVAIFLMIFRMLESGITSTIAALKTVGK